MPRAPGMRQAETQPRSGVDRARQYAGKGGEPMIRRQPQTPATGDRTDALAQAVAAHAYPLQTDDDLSPLLEWIGDAAFVLLGEASHGTSEYYTWRARISRRLIQEKGFSFVAVEGDWPDCYRVNRNVKHYLSPRWGRNMR